MQKIHLLSTGVLVNDPLLEWSGNHLRESTMAKCFEVDWTIVTHNEDRAKKAVHQVRDVPMDVNVLIDPDSRSKRDVSTLSALRSIPEGEWVWMLPEGAMIDVHAGSEILKMMSSEDQPIAIEKNLCRGVDHLIFRRPAESEIKSSSKNCKLFNSIRQRSKNMNCCEVYISRGAANDLDKLCVMYWNMKFWQHRYTEFYNTVLHEFRDRPCSLFEIGVAFGGSLRTWRDYLRKSTVVGLDSYEESSLDEFGITAIAGDSTTQDGIDRAVKVAGESFDIIIDDGDHRPQSQFDTMCKAWSALKDGGHYIIEDVYGFDWLVPEIERQFSGLKIKLIDQRLKSGYGDSVIIHTTK